ncbi:MAG: DUF1330 domain-containing protein [Rhodospirillales bacterium]|nr:DUF1330 domain-containing protein [Alphaproteobacteria bacterium]MBL6948284.1 DUF1330 domain-containing protein [Rhodospirillales bacterium]
MAAYIIVQIDVTDPDTFEVYRAQVPPTLEQYGGEYIVRGGVQEILEGDWPHPRCVVLKFPSMEQAKAWHESAEYEGPKALRQSASRGNMLVVEGV